MIINLSTTTNTLHRLINAVHSKFVFLVVNGDVLIARILRHVHVALTLIVFLSDSYSVLGHLRIHVYQVCRDYRDLLVAQLEGISLNR